MNSINVNPKTIGQKTYISGILDKKKHIIVATGPSGTGKTMLATTYGMNMLLNKEYKKLVLTRPAVTVDEEHGFLPGDLLKKMNPYLTPIWDYLSTTQSNQQIKTQIGMNTIEVCPLSHMRGRTFDDTFIIADEIQNASCNQVKMLLTRIGRNTKLVMTGDVKQSDRCKDNGLLDFVDKFKTFGYENPEHKALKSIILVELSQNDVQRSDAVKFILDIYGTELLE